MFLLFFHKHIKINNTYCVLSNAFLGYPFGAGITLDRLEIRTNKNQVSKYSILLGKIYKNIEDGEGRRE